MQEVKIKKFTWWWLLILTPLLLLIPFEKNIYIQTINSVTHKAEPNVSVYFHYEKQSARVAGSPVFHFRGKSDSNGVIKYEELRYRLYSWLFKHFSETLIYANTNCYSSDTLRPNFHGIWSNDTIKLPLATRFTDVDLKVIDKEDGEPLPDAKVEIISEFNGKEYREDAIAQADGRVVFAKVPKCGKITKVRAALDGYSPDSIVNKTVEAVLSNDSLRVLKLQPIRKKIEFFVVSCKSKQPLPGAKVTIVLENKGKKKSQTVHTNVNGVGKGFYDKAHVIATISLSASKLYYKTGVLAGKYTVREFIKLPKEKRTICLEPVENCIKFRNIDKKTKKPLAGVTNIVTIANGGSKKVVKVMSNKNGYFVVCEVVVGDKISIVSQKQPDYEDNNTKIKNEDGLKLLKKPMSARTIPLKPKEIEITFRTVKLTDPSSVIPNVRLLVKLNGRPISTPKSSGSGEFKVKAGVNDRISIVADGRPVKYTLNDTTIRNKVAKLLKTAPQSARDIPLRKPEYTVDVVFLIDLSGSMSEELAVIQHNIPNFYSLLSSKMTAARKYPEIIRLKLIGFHDNKLEKTKFYYVPDELSLFRSAIASFGTSGGAECGLDALSVALQSKWQTAGLKKRRIIFLFTDDGSEPFKSCPENTYIADHVALQSKWNSSQPDTYLVMFLDNGNASGYNALKPWKNVADFSISSYNFDRVVQEIVNRL